MRLNKRISDNDFFGGVSVYLSRISRSSSRGILLDNQLNVAMMYMSKFDIYKLPGGGIEDGETKEETFLREIKEETGYEAEIIDELGYIEEHKIRTEFMQYSSCFVAKTLNTKTEVLLTKYERELGLELHWMTMEKALKFMNDSFNKCDEYSMKFMILRDKTILEEGSNKLGLDGGTESKLTFDKNTEKQEKVLHSILVNLIESFEQTGDIEKDARHFLEIHNFSLIAEHSIRVGNESKRLAREFGVDEDSAAISGFLHDISVVFPNNESIRVSKELGIDILPEEETFPLIIHQKISKIMAREIFNIREEVVLDAIGCHTTLRSNSTKLDQVLFVADKIEWDQKGTPPYIEDLKGMLTISLEHGAFAYIKYMWDQRDSLKVVHPWLADAYFELKTRLKL